MKRLGLFAALAVLAPAGAYAQTFSDPDFHAANWIGETASSAGNAVIIEHLAAGGNPGANVQISFEGLPDSWAVFRLMRPDFVWDPATQGAIENISFSIDAWHGGFPDQQTVAINLALMQDGIMYLRGTSEEATSWTTIGLNDLVQTSFNERNFFTNTSNFGSNPDFSAAGSPITFGIHMGYSYTQNPTPLITLRYDNLNIWVTPVPEPASAGLLLLGGLLLRRRRC